MKTYGKDDEICEAAFLRQGPFWRIRTPEELSGTLFSNRDDFIFGMNLVAVCTALSAGIRVLTFTLEPGRLFFLLGGEAGSAEAFFLLYRKRLKRYLADRVRYPDLTGLTPGLLRIPDLQAFRDEAVFINRHACIGQPGHTPYSYPWSAGILYFNPLLLDLPKVPLSRLSQAKRRAVSHSRLLQLPGSYQVYRGIIVPSSYCAISEGESYFRNARQYFRLLGRPG
ncbi:MAG: hypothetical protein K5849_06235 [Bacteroidales bacterium]|nr:hypothetical protein [Bacteroidales bacterium]